jgi:methyl-accepting chemotaxis protein
MFKNMKIGMRLGLAFSIVLILLLVVVTMAISRMGLIDDALTEITRVNNVEVQYVEEMRGSIRDAAITLSNLTLTNEMSGKQTEKNLMDTQLAHYNDALEKLEKMFSTDTGTTEEEKKLLAKVKEDKQAAKLPADKAVQLSLDKKLDEAEKVMLTEVLPLQDKLLGDLGGLVDLEYKLIDESTVAAEKTFNDARSLIIAIGILASVLSVGLAIWITISITRPMNEAVKISNQLAEGDLTMKIEVSSRDETGMLLMSMRNMVEKLSQIISEVRGAADNLSSASEEVSATAQSMSQASSEQAASVEETSASVEQMSASINQNTENAKVTDGMASKAAREATEGGESVKQTVAAMQQIAKKIGIIDDIAYQTNLLALNAAIEAARAGEHGKGFAVVAAEVRKLAERSQVAAQEIGEVASSSVDLAERAGNLLDEMVPSINKTSDLVQEITAASEEQSSSVGQINTAMSQLSQITQQNASASEELAATAEEMSSQAEQLQQTMSFFKVDSSSIDSQYRPAVSKTAASGGITQPVKIAAAAHAAGSHNKAEFVKF